MMKTRFFLCVLMLLSGVTMHAQESDSNESNEPTGEVHDVVEQMPTFGGGTFYVTVRNAEGKLVEQERTCEAGQSGLFKYLSQSIRYPVVAEENGVQGRVIVTFIVERDGSINEVQVAKAVHPLLDKEAIRVIKGMPKWIPGKLKGEAVRVKYTVPVTFRLK